MSFDTSEQQKSTKLLIVLAILLLIIIAFGLYLAPDFSATLTEFNQGMGFKTGAIYAFFTTLVLMIILAIAGGDGLIGEIQFLLIGFLVFFFIIWLFITWIF
jgi:type II secretory pathway component PulF